MNLQDEGMCFVCGPNNPIGLKLKFTLEDGRYITRFTPGREHQGYTGITHGGLVCTVLDEVMARLIYALGHRAVTADMRVRLRMPARTGEELTFSGWVVSEGRRVIDCAAEARDSEGRLVADATARMVRVKDL